MALISFYIANYYWTSLPLMTREHQRKFTMLPTASVEHLQPWHLHRRDEGTQSNNGSCHCTTAIKTYIRKARAAESLGSCHLWREVWSSGHTSAPHYSQHNPRCGVRWLGGRRSGVRKKEISKCSSEMSAKRVIQVPGRCISLMRK